MMHAISFRSKIVCDSNTFNLSININAPEVIILNRAPCWAQEHIGEQNRCEFCPLRTYNITYENSQVQAT